jgi:hypothetical protein
MRHGTIILALAALPLLSAGSQTPEAPAVQVTAEIHGTVFQDLNSNGKLDPGEPGVPGVTIKLTGSVTTTVVSDSTGAYVFTGLHEGSYTVCAATSSPRSQPADGPSCPDGGKGWAIEVPPRIADPWFVLDFGFLP